MRVTFFFFFSERERSSSKQRKNKSGFLRKVKCLRLWEHLSEGCVQDVGQKKCCS